MLFPWHPLFGFHCSLYMEVSLPPPHLPYVKCPLCWSCMNRNKTTHSSFMALNPYFHNHILSTCFLFFYYMTGQKGSWDWIYVLIMSHCFSYAAPIKEPYTCQSINLYWMSKLVIEWSELNNLEGKQHEMLQQKSLKILYHPICFRRKINGDSWDLCITYVDEYLLHHESYWKIIPKIFLRN